MVSTLLVFAAGCAADIDRKIETKLQFDLDGDHSDQWSWADEGPIDPGASDEADPQGPGADELPESEPDPQPDDEPGPTEEPGACAWASTSFPQGNEASGTVAMPTHLGFGLAAGLDGEEFRSWVYDGDASPAYFEFVFYTASGDELCSIYADLGVADPTGASNWEVEGDAELFASWTLDLSHVYDTCPELRANDYGLGSLRELVDAVGPWKVALGEPVETLDGWVDEGGDRRSLDALYVKLPDMPAYEMSPVSSYTVECDGDWYAVDADAHEKAISLGGAEGLRFLSAQPWFTFGI